MEKISVVIIAYNEEENIGKCINSILNQTHKPYEIIVVNDGSTDNTLKVLKKYKTKIKIINKKKNKGRAEAYVSGFGNAKGNFVAFIDGDSYAPKTWLQKILAAFKKSPKNTACVGGYYRCSNKKYRIPKLEDKYNQIAMQKRVFKFPSGTNMAYNKKICEKIDIFKNLPKFRCDRYAMDLLIKNKYLVKIISCYVFSKAPKTFFSYLKQRFRWGRGDPNAKLIRPKVFAQKSILLVLPILVLMGSILWPFLFWYVLAGFMGGILLFGILFSKKFKKVSAIDSIQLIVLKLFGYYAHTIGYFFEVLRGLI